MEQRDRRSMAIGEVFGERRGPVRAAREADDRLAFTQRSLRPRSGHRPFRCLVHGGACRCPLCGGRDARCPLCRGAGVVRIEGPALQCRYCGGRGRGPGGGSGLCPACRGRGWIPVAFPLEICPTCGGRGRRTGEHLPCLGCRGRGVRPAVDPPSETLGSPGARLLRGPGDVLPVTADTDPARGGSPSLPATGDAGITGDDGIAGWLARMTPRARSSEPDAHRTNMATINRRARKVIATEWARACGRAPHRSRYADLEGQAARWREEEDRQRREAEAAAARLARFVEAVEGVLATADGRPAVPTPAELLDPIAWIYGERTTTRGGTTRLYVQPRDRRRYHKPRRPSPLYRLDLDENLHLTVCAACSEEEHADIRGG